MKRITKLEDNIFYVIIVIKRQLFKLLWYWHDDRPTYQLNKEFRNRSTTIWSNDFQQRCKAFSLKKCSLCNVVDMLGNLDIPIQKEKKIETGFFSIKLLICNRT